MIKCVLLTQFRLKLQYTDIIDFNIISINLILQKIIEFLLIIFLKKKDLNIHKLILKQTKIYYLNNI